MYDLYLIHEKVEIVTNWYSDDVLSIDYLMNMSKDLEARVRECQNIYCDAIPKPQLKKEKTSSTLDLDSNEKKRKEQLDDIMIKCEAPLF